MRIGIGLCLILFAYHGMIDHGWYVVGAGLIIEKIVGEIERIRRAMERKQ